MESWRNLRSDRILQSMTSFLELDTRRSLLFQAYSSWGTLLQCPAIKVTPHSPWVSFSVLLCPILILLAFSKMLLVNNFEKAHEWTFLLWMLFNLYLRKHISKMWVDWKKNSVYIYSRWDDIVKSWRWWQVNEIWEALDWLVVLCFRTHFQNHLGGPTY